MDIYHIWCDLKPDVKDLEFAKRLETFMELMRAEGRVESWRLTRSKLGLKPDHVAEWHIMIETTDLAQLDKAFKKAAARDGEVDDAHFAANNLVTNVKFALFRDFPDR